MFEIALTIIFIAIQYFTIRLAVKHALKDTILSVKHVENISDNEEKQNKTED